MRKQMISVLVLAEYFPHGMQPWLTNWVEEIVCRGMSVRILAQGMLVDSFLEKEIRLAHHIQIEYRPLDTAGQVWRALTAFLLPFTKRGILAYRGLSEVIVARVWRNLPFKELIKIVLRAAAVNSGNYDIIHSHTIEMSHEYLFLKEVKRVPLVTTFHGMPPNGVDFMGIDRRRKVFQVGDLFVVNTQYAKHQLAMLGCAEDKISVLPQGTKLQDFPFVRKLLPVRGKLIILTVGRLHKEKGHIYAIHAIGNLVRLGIDLEYRIIGVGPEKESLLRLIADEGLGDHVIVMGGVFGSELVAQYRAAHIFVLPSLGNTKNFNNTSHGNISASDGIAEDTYGWAETQGVVIQEAQASGVIVIATRTGGIPECVIDGENAFLVPEADSRAIVEKIRYVLSRPEKWSEWQDNARKYVEENFAVEMLAERLAGIYEKLIVRHETHQVGADRF